MPFGDPEGIILSMAQRMYPADGVRTTFMRVRCQRRGMFSPLCLNRLIEPFRNSPGCESSMINFIKLSCRLLGLGKELPFGLATLTEHREPAWCIARLERPSTLNRPAVPVFCSLDMDQVVAKDEAPNTILDLCRQPQQWRF